MHTLFIATIALVAPFIPVEIEVLAYNACRKRDSSAKWRKEPKNLGFSSKSSNLRMSCYTSDLGTTPLQISYLLT